MSGHSTTWVTVSRRAITHNIGQIQKILSPTAQLMVVVKSNAYGHGLIGCARIAQSAGITWFGTVSLEEALTLRRNGIKGRILVLSFFDPDKLTDAIKNNITLTVYNLSAALTINRLAKKLNKTVPIHLKIDTGTTRLGVMPSESAHVAKAIQRLQNIRLEGLFSHLANAENPNQRSANNQIRIFNHVVDELARQEIRVPYPHIACSAASILNRSSHYTMARIGIALYGLWSIEHNGVHASALKLWPALSWYTRVLQVKTVTAGTSIGYGSTYTARKTTKIAIIPVGYWDGYDRKFSNNGEVLVRGRRCQIRGRVCMNLTMIDVTNVPAAKPGDKVTLIGTDGRQTISVDSLAKRIGTINYEIVTRINPLLPRLYY